ncbi:zinc ribbon domain-containing protein [Actinophytocola sp.]|uniref:zinc ribbon domain-containing protein n=1 Tax=Actinophytocola sp. TaxID=1872138 RepID=UPI0025C3BB81|nr:zinc ribbon domain-containing protein [Actinophytocola sp.]
MTPLDGKATATQPESVVPQEARKKAPTVRRQPPSRKLQPGDLVCGDCGEGNAQTRKFCSRCGTSLATAEIVRTPWWRKLLPRRGAKVRRSGDRPKRRGRGGKSKTGVFVSATFKLIRRVVSVVVLLAGIAYGVFAPFRGWVNERAIEVKSGVEGIFFPTYEPVHASEPPVAPLQLEDFPAEQALDGASDTAWAAPADGKQEPVIEVTFGRQVDLARLIVHNGQKENFKGRARAQKLHLVFSTGKTTDVTLQDAPDPQTLEIENGDGASSVEIHVTGTFKSMAGNEFALTELEFFEKT